MVNYQLAKVAGKVESPVSVDDCKLDIKITDDEQDSLLKDYITAANALVGGKDGIVGKVLTTEVWELKLASVRGLIELPLSPVKSIVSIKYFDLQNQEQMLSVDDFYLFGDEDRAFLEPNSGKNWPDLYRRRDAITIRFNAGFGRPEEVPANITRAIRLIVAHWFENRSAVLVGVTSQELPLAVDSLLGISRKGWSA